MNEVKKLRIDVIIFWELDLLGRSLKQLVMALEDLSNLGVGFNLTRIISISPPRREDLCFTSAERWQGLNGNLYVRE